MLAFAYDQISVHSILKYLCQSHQVDRYKETKRHLRALTQEQGSRVQLPSLNIEALFRELSGNDGPTRELTAGECLDGFLCRVGVLVLDVDFANTEVDAGTSGAWNLCLDDGTVLAAFLLNVFLDFCNM